MTNGCARIETHLAARVKLAITLSMPASRTASIHPDEHPDRTGRSILGDNARAVALDVADGEPKLLRSDAQLRQNVHRAEPHQPERNVGSGQFAGLTLPVDDMEGADWRRARFNRPVDADVHPLWIDDLHERRPRAKTRLGSVDRVD